MNKNPKPTFDQLAKLQPSLNALLEQAKEWHRRTPIGFCGNAVFHGFAGHYCSRDSDPLLRTSDAYDVVYETISQALPLCDGITCRCGIYTGRTVGNRTDEEFVYLEGDSFDYGHDLGCFPEDLEIAERAFSEDD